MKSSIWITGGKGFLGRNLAKTLSCKLHGIYGLGHGFWTQDDFSPWGFKSWLNAEINLSSLSHLASTAGMPSVIFHLAGGSAVGPSIQNPYEDFQRTVETTARLLEWVRQYSPETKVVGVSSAAVYGSGFSGPISEQAQGTPFSPYGFHKAMLEGLFASYRENYGLQLNVTRLFSVYGPGLEKQLLWDICQKLEKTDKNEILLHGSGRELRDWVHVKDASELLWQVANIPALPQVVNGGTGKSTSIAEIANLVLGAWGCSYKVIFSGIARKGDPESLVADITLARKFGYSPKISVGIGVAEFVQWYRARQR